MASVIPSLKASLDANNSESMTVGGILSSLIPDSMYEIEKVPVDNPSEINEVQMKRLASYSNVVRKYRDFLAIKNTYTNRVLKNHDALVQIP